MAHFLTLVLVDQAEPDPGMKAEAAILPFFADDLAAMPDGKMDGFRIGGQFDGEIWGKEQAFNLSPSEYKQRYGFDVVHKEDNIRPVGALRPNLVPYAIITPDGKWHDCEAKKVEDWEAEVHSLLVKNHDKIAVAMDCHS